MLEQVLQRKDEDEINPFEISGAAALPVNDPTRPVTPAISELGLQAELSASALQQPSIGNSFAEARESLHSFDGRGESGASVDLGMGLAAHTHALLLQRQAAVAGMPLSAINAKLEEFALEHLWDTDGSLADFSSIATSLTGDPSKQCLVGERSGFSAGRSPAAPGALGLGGLPPPPPSVVGVRPGSPGSRSATASVTATGKRDYLREEREAKELAQK